MRTVISMVGLVAMATLVVLSIVLRTLSWHQKSLEPILLRVEGSVVVNGELAAGVNVAFHPLSVDQPLCPVGRTDSQGIFYLTTKSETDGAPAGDYRITLIWPDPTIEYDECECPDPLIHDRFKGMYAAVDQSGYRATVNASSRSFSFNVWRPRSEDPVP